MSSHKLIMLKIGPESDGVLRNLFEHYMHDMAEWFKFDTEPDGRYSYDTSAGVWDRGCEVYLAKIGDSLAGFAIIGDAREWLGDIDARDLREFFVIRRFRRTGIGQGMARCLWNQHPGGWLVRVFEANVPAVPFWREVVAGYTDGAYVEERRVVNDRPWRFFRFESSHA